MSFTIPTGLILIYQEAGDALLEFGNVSRYHRVVYPPRRDSCNNCVVNSFAGVSSNVYRSGGPAPFTFGLCPICGGNGYLETENTERVKINVYDNPKHWIEIGFKVDVPDGTIQIRAYLNDLAKLMRAQSLELDYDKTQYGSRRFLRLSEMVPIGLADLKYCVGFWRKA